MSWGTLWTLPSWKRKTELVRGGVLEAILGGDCVVLVLVLVLAW
jgi:hypothetical protein